MTMPTRPTFPALRRFARPLGALVALTVASCDPKTTSPVGGTVGSTVDDVVPTIGSAASGANRDTVDVNSPLTVVITGTDNRTLRRLDITVKAGNTQLARDTSVNSAGGVTYARTVTVRLAGTAAGTQLRVISQAADLAGNLSRIDTLLLVTKDTLSPVVTLNQPGAATGFKLGDTLRVDISSADSSGLAKIYSQLYRILTPTDTVGVLVRTDSVAPPASSTSLRSVFPIVYNLGLTAGNYGVRVRAVDVSGNVTRVPQVYILLRDPTITRG